ncbi:MAG: ORF6N domain-containing protein [Symbiopectobacterium sp.]
MSKIITIQNTHQPVIEYQGRRVIMTELLAQGYGATTQNIRQNFNNKSRFVEGKHYYFAPLP